MSKTYFHIYSEVYRIILLISYELKYIKDKYYMAEIQHSLFDMSKTCFLSMSNIIVCYLAQNIKNCIKYYIIYTYILFYGEDITF